MAGLPGWSPKPLMPKIFTKYVSRPKRSVSRAVCSVPAHPHTGFAGNTVSSLGDRAGYRVLFRSGTRVPYLNTRGGRGKSMEKNNLDAVEGPAGSIGRRTDR